MISSLYRTSIYFLVLVVVGNISAFKTFQERLPNGDSVPHPCHPNYLWPGVGHKNRDGGGTLNPFGEDFRSNGYVWDECLCNRDSDGDGKTNGEELGDPHCQWTPGEVPFTTSGLSHPGICEPYDSNECSAVNDWEICSATEFECPAAQNEPEVMTFNMNFPLTAVPAKETTYMCMTFDLPQDGDFHVIADQPNIDNEYVAHHILIYGCDNGSDVQIAQPEECGMAVEECLNLIAIWSVGHLGTCHDDNFGFRIGESGFKKVMMQIHWNNPTKRADFTDSSGMRLFYTSSLRDNHAGMLMVGQRMLTIPPYEEKFTINGDCPSECTSSFPHDIYLARSLIHMHYMGISGSIEHKRGDELVNVLVDEPNYSYDRPVNHQYEVPLLFKAGDSINTTCNYKSTNKHENTYYGDATSDEMCYGFLTYYPLVPTLKECLSFGPEEYSCPGHDADFEILLGDCDYEEFAENQTYPISIDLLELCQTSCTDDCQQYLDELNTKPCFQPLLMQSTTTILESVVDEYLVTFIYNATGEVVTGAYVVSLLDQCNYKNMARPTSEDNATPGQGCGLNNPDISSAPSPHSSGMMLILVVTSLVLCLLINLSLTQ